MFFLIAPVFPGTPDREELSPIKIVASIFPLQEFASAVAGDSGRVDLLLPLGAEIHTWQPRPSDLAKLSAADVFLFIGSDLEPWADDILRSVDNPNLITVEACQDLTLLVHEDEGEGHHVISPREKEHESSDPHIWLDFANDQMIIEKLVEVFASVYPEKKAIFRKNADIYDQKLRALDEKYQVTLDRCDHRTIVLGGHAAFGYLARRYGLIQLSLYGLSPDSKPTPRQMIEVIDFIKENGITAIFFEATISPELARVITDETGAETLVLNAGASLPRKQKDSGITFLEIMEKNLESLKNGLRCR